ncbi:hypothetical protein HHL22_10835 [Hymenobacter sp. RP-2-7]|uniref:DUF7674 domain-containing protein n=1 Tax=Hymenobacter polaris TaxID=2682546 RepID=A0A7Y0FMR7_9BACT|nr:hypothetical protein [Hymenobacter polaris]NML65700.1 hypothetical protein [Hymenobacter polaris]
MIPQAVNIEFSQGHINKVFVALTSTDEELRNYFSKYIHNEYDDDLSERLYYLDIAEIARFLVDKVEMEQTIFFQDLFAQIEVILSKCDSYVDELVVFGLFESIQNNCSHRATDYYYSFDKWLHPISKQKWDGLIDRWEGEDWRDKGIDS